jgi:protein-disulfide isomerase
MSKKNLFVLSAIVLLMVFVVGTLVYHSSQSRQSAEAVEQNAALLVRDHSPTFGNPQAKVHIVEFFDPACETCRAFYPYVKQLIAAHPDRIRLSMRYAPFHHNSDRVVKILEAARKQGKYWETLETLLANQEGWVRHHEAVPDMAWKYVAGLGLDLRRLENDLNAPDITRLVLQDIEDARALRVTKTPEFFVNGRPMPSFGYEQLRTLVEEELEKAYR